MFHKEPGHIHTSFSTGVPIISGLSPFVSSAVHRPPQIESQISVAHSQIIPEYILPAMNSLTVTTTKNSTPFNNGSICQSLFWSDMTSSPVNQSTDLPRTLLAIPNDASFNAGCTEQTNKDVEQVDHQFADCSAECNNNESVEGMPTISPYDVDSPADNTQKQSKDGRNKLCRCRQCSFTCHLKDDFWRHQRTHIRPDKILECPRCPFVTEYRHHLEYHLRNHIGSKPFRCIRCHYSCVNLSMLRSHMKSHLKPSQYRCNDCPFVSRTYSGLQVHTSRSCHVPASEAIILGPSLPAYNLQITLMQK